MTSGPPSYVRSLNLAVRKRETERIENENHAFARRLYHRSPEVDHNKLEEDYQARLKMKNRLKKVDIQLPPIDKKHKTHRRKRSKLDPLAGFDAPASEAVNISKLSGANIHGDGGVSAFTHPGEQTQVEQKGTEVSALA